MNLDFIGGFMNTLKDIIEEAVHLTLLETGGNKSEAARVLDCSRNTVKKYAKKRNFNYKLNKKRETLIKQLEEISNV